MTTVALNRETRECWNFIKNASSQTKLTLITLLSSSMSNGDEVIVRNAPLKVHRPHAMTDEELERSMQGEPLPIVDNDNADLADIISANSGKIVKGLDRWL